MRWIIVGLVVPLALTARLVIPVDASSVTAVARRSVPSSSSCATNSNTNGGAVLRRTAAEALAEMDAVIAKDPALAASLQKTTVAFAARGAKPTGRWTVVHLDAGSIRPVQNGQVWDGPNTIAWYSYDDGDWSTWKGTVYLANTATGQAGTWAQQTDLSNPATLMQPQWSVSTYWHEESRRGPASWSAPDVGALFRLRDVSNTGHPLRRYPDFMGFYGCSTIRCGAVAAGCMLFAGPGAPGCFAGGCTVGIITCSFGNLWASLGGSQ